MNEIFDEFIGFSRIPRYSRECIITEKIDGTNAQIYIAPDGIYKAGSRTRWLTLENDNFGFAAWVEKWHDELIDGLGPGRHFGEWWGPGIQRGYGLRTKRFSLFNVTRWGEGGTKEENLPACCDIVPILFRGDFTTFNIMATMQSLEKHGSYASPGFMRPEGIVIYHIAGNYLFKKTFEKDEKGKENA